jgi:DNA-binding MarR family transcriptional regulator
LTNVKFYYNIFNVTLIFNVRFNINKSNLISEAIELDRRIHRVVRRHSSAAWMGLNLTVPQVKTLFFVSNHPGTSPTRLAEALKVTPPNVTGIVDRLVEQGLLARQISPEDRRALVLHLTEKGESILSGLRERQTTVMQAILGYIDPEELSQIIKALSGLAEAARAYEENTGHERD